MQVLTNYFDTTQAQQFLQVTNLGATPANLSSISIKLWVDDTSGSNVVPSISTGGCITDTPSSQNCVHQVTGVVGVATPVTPACGLDTNHAGNWEIKISNTDGTVLAPGQTWNNIQVQLHLASWGTFIPGASFWYSPTLSGSSYVTDNHFVVYYADIACNRTAPCTAYLCGSVTCTASDACHIAGTCNPATGLCSNPVGPNGTPCNDGSVCTQTDQCIAGLCTGANPVTCTASDMCHVAGICDPLAGCTNPAAPDGTACNDGSACTVGDLCQSGGCQPGLPVPIDDLNPCTTDACDPVAGVTHTPATGTCCSDGNACNGNEPCNASGTCQAGAAVTCEAGPCYPGGSCSLTLTTPTAYPADSIVLGAVDNIDIGSFATVSGPSAGIVALGCSGVQLGMVTLATTSVWSGGRVVLDYNAKVDGNVEAGSQPGLYPGATITGNSVVRSGLPSLNNQRIDLTFGNCVNDVILESNQVKPIKPGQYRTVSVKANAKLQLGRGHYWFDSLSVESGGTIEVNAPSDNPNAPPGSLTIVVRGSATLGGSTTFPLGTIDFKLLVGGSDVVLSAPFSGTVIAPNAHIAFNSTVAPYQGSFPGKVDTRSEQCRRELRSSRQSRRVTVQSTRWRQQRPWNSHHSRHAARSEQRLVDAESNRGLVHQLVEELHYL